MPGMFTVKQNDQEHIERDDALLSRGPQYWEAGTEPAARSIPATPVLPLNKNAELSLVFGVVGWLALPLIGAVIAIILI